MKISVLFLSFIFAGLAANASNTFSFVDKDGNNGTLTIQTSDLLKCNEQPHVNSSQIEYKGQTRSFMACWDQNRITEKVIHILGSNLKGEIDLAGQLLLNPVYLQAWGRFTSFENSGQQYGCEKNAGGFLHFGNGIETPFEIHFICFDN